MIFGLVKHNNGASFHRIQVPLLMMENTDVYVTNNYSEQLFNEKKPSVVVYNREISEQVINAARSIGAKVVCDIDDYWELDPHHVAHNHYQKVGYANIQIKHIQQADLVTVTHERLAEMVYPYNKNVHILPNAIAKCNYFPTERQATDNVKLFWQGSITHAEDLKILAPVMDRLKGNFMAVLAGVHPDLCEDDAAEVAQRLEAWHTGIKESVYEAQALAKIKATYQAFRTDYKAWQSMINSFTAKKKMDHLLLPGTDVGEYYNYYRYADICLIPLLNTKFNSFKSNLKCLEAAHMGLPVIASKVQPYLNMPLMYARKTEDWLRLINDTAQQKEQAEYLQAWVAKHHNFNEINAKRKQLYEQS